MRRFAAGVMLACTLTLSACGGGATKTVVRTVTASTTAPTSSGTKTATTTEPTKSSTTPAPTATTGGVPATPQKIRATVRKARAICGHYPPMLPALPARNSRKALVETGQAAVGRLVPVLVKLQAAVGSSSSGAILVPLLSSYQQLSGLYSRLQAPLKAKQITAMRKQIRAVIGLARKQARALGLPSCAPRVA